MYTKYTNIKVHFSGTILIHLKSLGLDIFVLNLTWSQAHKGGGRIRVSHKQTWGDY